MPDTILGSTLTTETINVGGSRTSVIDFSGDSDWFRVQLVAGGRYTFTLSSGNFSIPVLQLLDANGVFVASNTDSDGSTSFTFLATATGTYYLDVRAQSEVGGYVLTAEGGASFIRCSTRSSPVRL